MTDFHAPLRFVIQARSRGRPLVLFLDYDGTLVWNNPYSGGLGILAGDTLGSAADLGIPMVGVTLLHGKGIFTSIWMPREIKPKAQPLWR